MTPQSANDKFKTALRASASSPELFRLARESSLIFVRSLDQLAEDHPCATGRRLTAREALDAYGREVLLVVLSEGSALLCASPAAAGIVIKRRRETLGLDRRHVANKAGVDARVVEAAEESRRLPLRNYERIARVLSLDERFISVRSEPIGNERLAVRLRTIGEENVRMTPSVTSAIAEAAWVASAQIRMEECLGIHPPLTEIEPSANYGSPDDPAYVHGYLLAQEARRHLKLGSEQLPISLREICEDRLGIPMIQAELGEFLAGVTVAIGDRRAIVLNRGGRNSNVYIRRSTIAHELGHLLYDIEARLHDLQVDDFGDLERSPSQVRDPVEQRANAFGIEFIAPQTAVLSCYESHESNPIGAVMRLFGISHTAARNQILNGLKENRELPQPSPEDLRPLYEFEAMEAYATDFHPIPGIAPSRAGRFGAVVLRSADEKIISRETAAEYLGCSEETLESAAEHVRGLWPSVFAGKS